MEDLRSEERTGRQEARVKQAREESDIDGGGERRRGAPERLVGGRKLELRSGWTRPAEMCPAQSSTTVASITSPHPLLVFVVYNTRSRVLPTTRFVCLSQGCTLRGFLVGLQSQRPPSHHQRYIYILAGCCACGWSDCRDVVDRGCFPVV